MNDRECRAQGSRRSAMSRPATDKAVKWVVLLSCLTYAGCVDKAQLDWNYKVLRVCGAVEAAAREGPDNLFTQRQVAILSGEPDKRIAPSADTSKVNGAIERSAIEDYIRYRRRHYGVVIGEKLSLSREEENGFRDCEIWVYDEAARYRTPLPEEPRFTGFMKYIVIFERGRAIGGGAVPQE